MVKTVVSADLKGLEAGIDFVEESLEKLKFKRKYINEAMLLSEESMVRLIDHAPIGSTIHIHIKRTQGVAGISLSAPGKEISKSEFDAELDLEGNIDRTVENSVRDILLRSFEEKICYSRKGNYNFFRVTAGAPEKIFAATAVLSFVAAIVIGILMKNLLGASFLTAVDAYFFAPVQKVFIKLLMLCTAPAVFFSIITGVSRYTSFFDPGRVSIKVLVGYAITSILAIAIGAVTFDLLQPGEFGILRDIGEGLSEEVLHPSFVDTLIDIVPADIVTPFLNIDAAQLVFLALVCGLALGRTGDYSAPLLGIINALNVLFYKVADILMNFIPIAAFCSTISMILHLGPHILLDLAEMLGTLLVALLLMLLLYGLSLAIGCRLDPFVLLKKFFPCLKETFIRSSGMAALPKNMRCCKNSLGISPKVYSFSMPFGSVVNMDGNCIYLTVAGLFLARLCGIEITSGDIIPLAFFVLVITMGAPITRGAVLLCLTVILNQMGAPSIALSLLIGVNAAVEMFLAASDTLSDVAVSLMVASSENLIDRDVYNAKGKARK